MKKLFAWIVIVALLSSLGTGLLFAEDDEKECEHSESVVESENGESHSFTSLEDLNRFLGTDFSSFDEVVKYFEDQGAKVETETGSEVIESDVEWGSDSDTDFDFSTESTIKVLGSYGYGEEKEFSSMEELEEYLKSKGIEGVDFGNPEGKTVKGVININGEEITLEGDELEGALGDFASFLNEKGLLEDNNELQQALDKLGAILSDLLGDDEEAEEK